MGAQSDQYKYCDGAPAAKKCSSTEEVAYTSVQIFRGEIKIQSSDKIHCVCPDGHNYLDTEYKFKEEGEISEMMVNYFCLPVSLHFWNLPLPDTKYNLYLI